MADTPAKPTPTEAAEPPRIDTDPSTELRGLQAPLLKLLKVPFSRFTAADTTYSTVKAEKTGAAFFFSAPREKKIHGGG